jgi:predicted TIM-barrel fold metal-dependent hydrolase
MTTRIDLSGLDVIDEHCHPFKMDSRVLRVSEFELVSDYMCLYNPSFVTPSKFLHEYQNSHGARREELENEYQISKKESEMKYQVSTLLLSRKFVHELSRFLGCKPEAEAIIEARNKRSAEYKEYIGELFRDARIRGLLVDDGCSEMTVEYGIPLVDIDAFKTYVPARVERVTRIEPLFQKSLDKSATLEDMESDFLASMTDSVKKRNAVAFKCVIAYRSGLEIAKPVTEAARKDFQKYKETEGRKLKALRDFMIWRSIEKTIELDVPYQVHTGVGDTDIVLPKCSPYNLWTLLKDEHLRQAKIVLVHAGYPTVSEAAFLASVLPNVYLDLSILIPLAHSNPSRINDVLELAPLSKVMYASDVHLPDMYWLTAIIGKKMLATALSKVVDSGALDEDEAYEAAKMILSENVKRLYRLAD